MVEISGNIFKIRRFSIHDGPGIRTSVFLKGCQMNCVWCHSPEGIGSEISVCYNPNSCIQCKKCVTECPNLALHAVEEPAFRIEIDYDKCNLKGNCVTSCPTSSMQYTGWKVSSAEVFEEIIKDIEFYHISEGV